MNFRTRARCVETEMAETNQRLTRVFLATILWSLPGAGLVWLTGTWSFAFVAVFGAALGAISTIAGLSPARVLRMAVALVASNAVSSGNANSVYQAVMDDDPSNPSSSEAIAEPSPAESFTTKGNSGNHS
jgi:hypothetical protein